MSEKTTSEFMLEISSHYLMNGCDDCPFYNVIKTCDSKPINCKWMVLQNYFKAEESKEESKSAEPERKTGKWVYKPNEYDDSTYECSQCGEPWTLIDGTPEENNMNFCPNCCADMRGENGKA